MNLDIVLGEARVAVQQAARICAGIQQSISGQSLTKGDRSPVTAADLAAQVIVIAGLQEATPDIPIVAEESAEILRGPEGALWRQRVTELVTTIRPELRESDVMSILDRGQHHGGRTGPFWVLDPIDGTKGFLRGDQYAIALGLVIDGKLAMGVLGCPNLDYGTKTGCIYSARTGSGAMVSGLNLGHMERVNVNDWPLESANFCESVEAAHSAHGSSAQIAELLGISAPPVRIDSQCKYAMVAHGAASIYLRLPTRKDYVEKIWDHAAGAFIVTEAGGRVSDTKGQPLDFSIGRGLSKNAGVVVTNAVVHDAVIEAIGTVLYGA